MLSNKSSVKKSHATRGFSLVEVMVTIAIISIVLAISVSRYGSFNNVVLLKNQAFEIALDIRQAQTYASSVRVDNALDDSAGVNEAVLREEVGVALFGPGSARGNASYVTFIDQQASGLVRFNEGTDILLEETILDERFELYEICTPSGAGERCNIDRVDISFARPDYDATILEVIGATTVNTPLESVEIRLRSRSNNAFVRSVIVTASGQISVDTPTP